MTNCTENLDVAGIDTAIRILNIYAKEASIEPLISTLESLREDLHNEELLAKLTQTWRNLGVYQGTVLSYVPHFYTWIPDDIFGDNLK